MMIRTFTIRVLLALSSLSLFLGCTHPQQPMPSLQDLPRAHLAPDFVLPDLQGKRQRLSSLRGKVVLLNFWATWCRPCVEELPSLSELQGEIGEDSLRVLAVSVDSNLGDINQFTKRRNLKFPVLLDLSNTVKRTYQISSLPQSILIDKQGKMVLFPAGGTSATSTHIRGALDWQSVEVVDRIALLAQE